MATIDILRQVDFVLTQVNRKFQHQIEILKHNDNPNVRNTLHNQVLSEISRTLTVSHPDLEFVLDQSSSDATIVYRNEKILFLQIKTRKDFCTLDFDYCDKLAKELHLSGKMIYFGDNEPHIYNFYPLQHNN